MLGQPFSVIDNNSAAQDGSSSSLTPQSLERVHVKICERIIARNLGIHHIHKHDHAQDVGAIQYHEETKSLDHDLKKAARALPTTWWISPTIEDTRSDSSATERTAKLLLQAHQYYLLVLVHQPYLLRVMRWRASQTQRHSMDQAYSKMAIVSASREVFLAILFFANSINRHLTVDSTTKLSPLQLPFY